MAPTDVRVGTCAMCGIGLTNNFIIKSADGKKHSVGCDCVNKINDARLTTEIKEIQRKARLAKKEAERQAKADAREAELQAQRDRNGGLTDYELHVKAEKDALEAKMAPRIALLAPLAKELEDGKGGFRDSVAWAMKKGEIPGGRGIEIVFDILAKKAGRANSDAYNTRYNEVAEIFDKLKGE